VYRVPLVFSPGIGASARRTFAPRAAIHRGYFTDYYAVALDCSPLAAVDRWPSGINKRKQKPDFISHCVTAATNSTPPHPPPSQNRMGFAQERTLWALCRVPVTTLLWGA
jgi:hypothetical protein